MRMNAFAVLGLIAVVSSGVTVMTAACGGSSGSEVTAAPTDGGGGSESSTSSEASSGDPYTLDNVCDRTAPIICEARKSCCSAPGAVGYDEAGCLAHARSECARDVADTRAGKATFHADRVEPCIAKIKTILAESCTLTFDFLQKYIRDIAACQTFVGSLEEGVSCDHGSQCKASASKDTFTGCDDDTKKCHTTNIVGANAPCSLANGLAVICDQGLYCDVDFGDAGNTKLEGVCRPKTALGTACDKTKKPVQLECGLGNYCDETTSQCTAGKAGGATCSGGFECASVTCDKGDAGAASGACKAPGTFAKLEECKGP